MPLQLSLNSIMGMTSKKYLKLWGKLIEEGGGVN